MNSKGYKSVENFGAKRAGPAATVMRPQAAPGLDDGAKSQNLRAKKLNPIPPLQTNQAANTALNIRSKDPSPELPKAPQRDYEEKKTSDKIKETISASCPESSIEVEDRAKSNGPLSTKD